MEQFLPSKSKSNVEAKTRQKAALASPRSSSAQQSA